MAGEDGVVGEVRLLLGEQPLEPEQQRVGLAPGHRGVLGARVQLGQGGVEGAAARRARGQRLLEGLALVEEGLAREVLRALKIVG